MAIAALVAAAAVAVLVYSRLRPSADRGAAVPAPPVGARQSAAVTAHLAAAYRSAQAAGLSAAAIGDYCVALHADMFYELAERCYGAAIDRAGSEWQWVYYRSLIRSDLGGGGDLSTDLRTVTTRAPGFSPAWLRLGDAEFKAGRYAEAEQAWKRAIEVPEPRRLQDAPVPHLVEVPASSYAALGLVRIQMIRGDTEAAHETLESVLRATPSFGSAHRLLSEIETLKGRSGEAARALARARRLPPYAAYADPMIDVLALESRNSTFLLRLASEAGLEVNAGWSEFLARRALEFDPDNPEVVLKLGRILRTAGRNEEALTYFQRYRQLVPADVQVLADIASCLSDLGRFSEAEPLLRKAVGSLDDPVSHYNLGLLLASTGRLDEAVGEYQRALDRDPGHIAARSNLAAVLVRKGQIDRAASELERVLETDPEDVLALTNLGLVRVQSGDRRTARRLLSEALRINPKFQPASDALRSLDTD